MRAVVHERYGATDVLEMRDVDRPELRDDAILIRVLAASVNRSDWEALTARPVYVRFAGSGFLRPKHPILGSDIAGRVEAVGTDVTRFKTGDEVFGDIMWFGNGGFAEYVCVSERAPLVPKPPEMTFENAAAIPQAGVLGLQGLRYKGQIEPGHKVLIIGAGGGGGTFAVQIAKSLGAEVTGVDNTSKLDMMRSIGADHVIDYTKEDFAKIAKRYDRILDFATHRSILANKRALSDRGIYAMVGGSVPRLFQTLAIGSLISKTTSLRMGLLIADPNVDDLMHLADLVEDGTITPSIERTYELAEVPEALTRLGQNNALGKLVITM